MTANKRIPVQILETKNPSELVTTIVTLCNDGTIWEISKRFGASYTTWQPLPNIPQSENTND